MRMDDNLALLEHLGLEDRQLDHNCRFLLKWNSTEVSWNFFFDPGLIGDGVLPGQMCRSSRAP
jgi:hypothetical protein